MLLLIIIYVVLFIAACGDILRVSPVAVMNLPCHFAWQRLILEELFQVDVATAGFLFYYAEATTGVC